HVRMPIRINLLSKGEIRGVAGPLEKPRASQRCSGIGGSGFLSVRLVPPHSSGNAAATTGIPTSHDISVKNFRLVQIFDVAGQIVSSGKRHRHPAFIIVIIVYPAVVVLAKVKTLDKSGILLSAGAFDPIQQRLPSMCIEPVTGEITIA